MDECTMVFKKDSFSTARREKVIKRTVHSTFEDLLLYSRSVELRMCRNRTRDSFEAFKMNGGKRRGGNEIHFQLPLQKGNGDSTYFFRTFQS